MAKTQETKDKVKIQLFKDSKRYKDDVFVGVNGKPYKIQRGKAVEVPAAVAEVLEHSMSQDTAAAEYMEQERAAYAKARDEMNI